MNLPDSSVHGILQARILEWVAILFSSGSSLPRDWTQVSCIAGRFFTYWASRETFFFSFTLLKTPFTHLCSLSSLILYPLLCQLTALSHQSNFLIFLFYPFSCHFMFSMLITDILSYKRLFISTTVSEESRIKFESWFSFICWVTSGKSLKSFELVFSSIKMGIILFTLGDSFSFHKNGHNNSWNRYLISSAFLSLCLCNLFCCLPELILWAWFIL